MTTSLLLLPALLVSLEDVLTARPLVDSNVYDQHWTRTTPHTSMAHRPTWPPRTTT